MKYHTPHEPEENIENYDLYGSEADYGPGVLADPALPHFDDLIPDPDPLYNPATSL